MMLLDAMLFSAQLLLIEPLLFLVSLLLLTSQLLHCIPAFLAFPVLLSPLLMRRLLLLLLLLLLPVFLQFEAPLLLLVHLLLLE